MNGKLWLAALLALLLVTASAVAAWSYGHRRYAYPVEYTRIAVVNSSPYWSLGGSTVIEEWRDARHQSGRTRIGGLAGPIDRVSRGGHAYDANRATRRLFAGPTLAAWLDWLERSGCGGLRDGGSRTVQLDIGSGYTALVHCARARVAPGMLPGDFFAPPGGSGSLWDRLRTWFSARVRTP